MNLCTRPTNAAGSTHENYTNQRWGDRENYDLMLNSGDLGIEKCVELICQAVSKRRVAFIVSCSRYEDI